MRVAAVMVVRNEEAYLANCLNHLINNGIDFYVIDNDSTDGTQDLLRNKPISEHLIGTETYPYPGHFDWTGLMQARERASRAVDADWVLFVSADEMMHSYQERETLSDAILRVGSEGWDVINFNEFVFLPVDNDYVPGCEGYPPLHYYYLFEPNQPRLMRARRSGLDLSHIGAGGHAFSGAPFNLAPENMALRHYIVRNQAHAYSKYCDRKFPQEEVAKGWHFDRNNQAREAFLFPPARTLHKLNDVNDRALERSLPRAVNYWRAEGS